MKFETIVVTGGIGSGKSFIAKAIQQKAETKVEYFNFDDFTKELYLRQDIQDFLMFMFGTCNRSKISDLVFGNEVMRYEINKFFFSHVEAKFMELVNRKAHSTLVIEFPMCFEMMQISNSIQLIRSKFKTISVTCDDATRYRRVQNRDGFSIDKIQSIVVSQMPQQQKNEYADYVIDTSNDGGLDQLDQLMRNQLKKAFYHVATV